MVDQLAVPASGVPSDRIGYEFDRHANPCVRRCGPKVPGEQDRLRDISNRERNQTVVDGATDDPPAGKPGNHIGIRRERFANRPREPITKEGHGIGRRETCVAGQTGQH